MFVRESKIMASLLEIFFSFINSLVAFVPLGKPHKKPKIIGVMQYSDILNNLVKKGLNMLFNPSIILVCNIISVNNIKGKSAGKTEFKKISSVDDIESTYIFEKQSSNIIKNKINKKSSNFFKLKIANFIKTPMKLYEKGR